MSYPFLFIIFLEQKWNKRKFQGRKEEEKDKVIQSLRKCVIVEEHKSWNIKVQYHPARCKRILKVVQVAKDRSRLQTEEKKIERFGTLIM